MLCGGAAQLPGVESAHGPAARARQAWPRSAWPSMRSPMLTGFPKADRRQIARRSAKLTWPRAFKVARRRRAQPMSGVSGRRWRRSTASQRSVPLGRPTLRSARTRDRSSAGGMGTTGARSRRRLTARPHAPASASVVSVHSGPSISTSRAGRSRSASLTLGTACIDSGAQRAGRRSSRVPTSHPSAIADRPSGCPRGRLTAARSTRWGAVQRRPGGGLPLR